MKTRLFGSTTLVFATFTYGAISSSAAQTLQNEHLTLANEQSAPRALNIGLAASSPELLSACWIEEKARDCQVLARLQPARLVLQSAQTSSPPDDESEAASVRYEPSRERSWIDNIVITPRASIYFDNSNDRESSTLAGISDLSTPSLQDIYQDLLGPSANFSQTFTSVTNRAPQLSFEMYGASIGYNFRDDATQLSLTALFGETNSTAETILTALNRLSVSALAAEDAQFTFATQIHEIERTDIELTLQRRLDERFAVLGGFRYERFDTDITTSAMSRASSNIVNLANYILSGGSDPLTTAGASTVNITGSSRATLEAFSLRAGVSGYATFGTRQLAYVSGLAHVAHIPEARMRGVGEARSASTPSVAEPFTIDDKAPAETLIGPDITVGYQYRISDRFSFDARYRFQSYFPISGYASFDDPRVNHGFMLGVSAWLGPVNTETDARQLEIERTPARAPAERYSGWEFAFTPRASFYFDNIAQLEDRTNDQSIIRAPSAAEVDELALFFGEDVSVDTAIVGTSSSAPQIAWPLYGGSLTFGPRGGTAQYTLTALVGDANIRQRDVSVGNVDLTIGSFISEDIFVIDRAYTQELTRTDIELTAQWRLSESSAFLAGARFEQMEGEYIGETRASQSQMRENFVAGYAGATPLPTGFHYDLAEYGYTSTGEQNLENYSVRLGLAGFAPFDSRQLVYVNVFAHASYSPESTVSFTNIGFSGEALPSTRIVKPEETAIGPDVTVGYQFRLNDNVSFDARYRAIGYFALSGQRSFEDPRVSHGLTIGLSMWFGR